MKPSKLFLSAFFLVASLLRGADGNSYSLESRTTLETFTSKVLKVYSFEDGDSEYVAYVVNWKDHEVVVSPLVNNAATANYKIGDTVHCQMQQMYPKSGDPRKARISFFIVSIANVSTERQRLEAVSAEIESRRILRAQAESAPPTSP